jgi:hypothetical protein
MLPRFQWLCQSGFDHRHVMPSVLAGARNPGEDVPREEMDQVEGDERGTESVGRVHLNQRLGTYADALQARHRSTMAWQQRNRT